MRWDTALDYTAAIFRERLILSFPPAAKSCSSMAVGGTNMAAARRLRHRRPVAIFGQPNLREMSREIVLSKLPFATVTGTYLPFGSVKRVIEQR